jgi:hypothetical protein
MAGTSAGRPDPGRAGHEDPGDQTLPGEDSGIGLKEAKDVIDGL